MAPSQWEPLRHLRHRPPGAAATGRRREVFVAALEQAEQLFHAAGNVSPAARPLPLFYGLSQAGRAIAASRPQPDWVLRGHGIQATGLEGILPEVQIADRGDGSFTRLAATLGSPSLPHPIALSQLWATLPELVGYALTDNASRPVLFFQRENLSSATSLVISQVASGWLWGLPQEVIEATDPRQALTTFLEDYPTTAGWQVPGDPSMPMRFRRLDDVRYAIRLQWMAAEHEGGTGEEQRQERLDAIPTPYRSESVVFPALPGNTSPLEPILVWWAVLFALSMLARYEPAAWLSHLDVNHSPLAVPLEVALDRSLTVCPELLLQVISRQGYARGGG
jgi:hypothetical protein